MDALSRQRLQNLRWHSVSCSPPLQDPIHTPPPLTPDCLIILYGSCSYTQTHTVSTPRKTAFTLALRRRLLSIDGNLFAINIIFHAFAAVAAKMCVSVEMPPTPPSRSFDFGTDITNVVASFCILATLLSTPQRLRPFLHKYLHSLIDFSTFYLSVFGFWLVFGKFLFEFSV